MKRLRSMYPDFIKKIGIFLYVMIFVIFNSEICMGTEKSMIIDDENISYNSSNLKPNFLFFLMDDLGWKDLGCYGGSFIETPVADQLALDGMRFTQAYASPVCSPTRVSIISGQNTARHNVWEVMGVQDRSYRKMKSPSRSIELDKQIQTYADILNKQGYISGLFGKWHAGRTPEEHGFSKTEKTITDPVLNKYAEENKDHHLGAISANSIEFMRNNKDRPFFLSVSHHVVHAPLRARDELILKCNKKLRKTDIHPTYAAMVESADESLGILLNELEVLGLTKNTVVVFYSDNGGLISDMYLGEPAPLVTNIAPLRDQKGTLYEGGIRLPLLIKWPGKVKSGVINQEMVHSYDLFSIFIEIGGGTVTKKQKTDGISLLPLLIGKQQQLDRKALYWHFPTNMWQRSPAGAIRKGNYKLIEYFDDGRLELFNLNNDIGESENLLGSQPDKAAELLNDLMEWRLSVGAKMLTENPKYNPLKAHEHAYYKSFDKLKK